MANENKGSLRGLPLKEKKRKMFLGQASATETYEAMISTITRIMGSQGARDAIDISAICVLLPTLIIVAIIIITAIIERIRSKKL